MGAGQGAGADPVSHAPRRVVRSCLRVRLTIARREEFFAELAANCDVGQAAASIGVATAQVHYRRRSDPAFAADWDAAIRSAYQLLETRLIGHVMAGGGTTVPGDPACGVEALDWDQGIKLLTLHRTRGEGRTGSRNTRNRAEADPVATADDTDAAILRKLAALAARKARGADTGTNGGGAA